MHRMLCSCCFIHKLFVNININSLLSNIAGETPSIPEESVLKWWVFVTVVQNNELEDKVVIIIKKIASEVSPKTRVEFPKSFIHS